MPIAARPRNCRRHCSDRCMPSQLSPVTVAIATVAIATAAAVSVAITTVARRSANLCTPSQPSPSQPSPVVVLICVGYKIDGKGHQTKCLGSRQKCRAPDKSVGLQTKVSGTRLSFLVWSCRVLSGLVGSCRVLSGLVVSCLVLSGPVGPYAFLSCDIWIGQGDRVRAI